MLNTFTVWARQVVNRPLENDVRVQVTESETSDNPSARLDIDTPTMVARITCWESGDYNAEVIDLETEQMLFSVNGNLCVEEKLSAQFADFFKLLGLTVE